MLSVPAAVTADGRRNPRRCRPCAPPVADRAARPDVSHRADIDDRRLAYRPAVTACSRSDCWNCRVCPLRRTDHRGDPGGLGRHHKGSAPGALDRDRLHLHPPARRQSDRADHSAPHGVGPSRNASAQHRRDQPRLRKRSDRFRRTHDGDRRRRRQEALRTRWARAVDIASGRSQPLTRNLFAPARLICSATGSEMELALSLTWMAFVSWLILRAYSQRLLFPVLEPVPSAIRDPAASVSVIVPARNEAANLERCLKPLLDQTYPPDRLKIVVVDDHSADNTFAIASSIAQQAPNLTVVRSPPLPPHWVGKPHACWIGAKTASADAEWICFIDADV